MTKEEKKKLITVKFKADDWHQVIEALSLYGWISFDFGNKEKHQYAAWLKSVIATRLWEESEPSERGLKPTDDSKPIPISEKDLPF